MSRSRTHHQKESPATSEPSSGLPQEELAHRLQLCGKRVTDDWPEIVPITLDEIGIIESFMRKILDDLLN